MRKETRGTVAMAIDRCKGCELCIPACPVRVLAMTVEHNVNGFHYPVLSEGCTGCTACQKVCPDFVFEVYKLEGAVSDIAAH
jgi:2-oxoglutarate ferredoxin oxidoreductase subunit delta